MGIWIDTDMGFDDIAAILVVAHSNLAIDGVSLVMGNAPLEQVRANAASAAAAFGWTFPIHSGRSLPVLGKLETAQRILGDSGMSTTGRSLPAPRSSSSCLPPTKTTKPLIRASFSPYRPAAIRAGVCITQHTLRGYAPDENPSSSAQPSIHGL